MFFVLPAHRKTQKHGSLLERDSIGLYRDDIVVFDGSESTCLEVRRRLAEHGFTLKESERLSCAKLLGLEIREQDQTLWWRRSENISQLLEKCESATTIREAAQVLGKLGAKYPVQRWLRIHIGIARSKVGVEAHQGDWDCEISTGLSSFSRFTLSFISSICFLTAFWSTFLHPDNWYAAVTRITVE